MTKSRKTPRSKRRNKAIVMGLTGVMALPTIVAIAPNYASAAEVENVNGVQEYKVTNVKPNVISSNEFSMMAVTPDGKIAGWGTNKYGKFGLGHSEDQVITTPTVADNIEDVISVVQANENAIILKEDGTVWATGTDLNNIVYNKAYSFTKIAGLNDIVKISAKSTGAFALSSTGEVYAWGGGQAYYGGTSKVTKLSQLTNIKDIEAVGNNLVVIKDDGIAYFLERSLDTGSQNSKTFANSVAKKIEGLTDVKQISVNTGYSSIVLKEDGTVKLLDIGTQKITDVPSLTNIASVTRGGAFYLALDNKGDVFAWGNKNAGQLGDGETSGDRDTPEKIAKLSNIVAISSGIYSSIALDSSGVAYTWGKQGTYKVLGRTGTEAVPYPISGSYSTKTIVPLSQANTEPVLKDTSANTIVIKDGKPTLNINGTVKDTNIGDKVTIKYSIDGVDSSLQDILTTDGYEQPYLQDIILDNTLGTRVIEVWAEDKDGAKSEVKTITLDVTKEMLGLENRPELIDTTEDDVQIEGENLVLTMSGMIKDKDVGDKVTVKYSINGEEDSLDRVITANGKNQVYMETITLPELPAPLEMATFGLRTLVLLEEAGSKQDIKVWAEDDKGYKSEKSIITVTIPATSKEETGEEETGKEEGTDKGEETDTGEGEGTNHETGEDEDNGKDNSGEGSDTGEDTDTGEGTNTDEGSDTGEGSDKGTDNDNPDGDTDNGSNPGENTGGDASDGENSNGGNTDTGSGDTNTEGNTDTGSGNTGDEGNTDTGSDSGSTSGDGADVGKGDGTDSGTGSGSGDDKPSSGTGDSGNTDSGSVVTPPVNESGGNTGVTPPSNGTGSSTGGNTSGGSTGSSGGSTAKPTNPVIPSSPTLTGEQAKELGYVLLADKTTENDVMVAFSRQALSDTGKVNMLVNVAPKEDIIEPTLYMYYVKNGEESKPFSINDLDLFDKVALDTVKAGETLTLDVPTKLKIGKDYSVAAVVVDKNGKVYSKNELDSKTLKKYMVLNSVNSNLESKGLISKMTSKISGLFSSK